MQRLRCCGESSIRRNASDTHGDRDLPGFRFHPLKGDCNGFWAVTARANRHVTVRCEVVKLALVQHSDDSGRVTLMGDVPVGPDGSPSTIVEGEPIEPA